MQLMLIAAAGTLGLVSHASAQYVDSIHGSALTAAPAIAELLDPFRSRLDSAEAAEVLERRKRWTGFPGCECAVWSCESGVCGYDTADFPGACCVQCTDGEPPTPKPSCELSGGGGGGQACSETLGAGQFGLPFWQNPDPTGFCRVDVEQDTLNASFDSECVGPDHPFGDGIPGIYWSGSVCPAQFSCCYGGNYGDPLVLPQ